MHSLKLGSCTLSSVFIHLLLDFSLNSIIFVIWLILAVMASIAIAHTAYRVSHETWLLVNSFKCLLPYTVLDIKYFLQFISVRKYLTQIYIKIWLVCLFVCLYPINVKTAKPIRPKFCVGHYVIPGKVYEWSKFLKFVFKSLLFLFYIVQREDAQR